MAIEKVKEYFKKFNKEKDVIELKESSATVHDAAIALGCDEAHIGKTNTNRFSGRYIC